MESEIKALKKYRVFALTPERRKLLGRALIDLEKQKTTPEKAIAELNRKMYVSKKAKEALYEAFRVS